MCACLNELLDPYVGSYSNEYQGNCWLAYDKHFRQQAASSPNCKWSNIDSNIWNLPFTSQARASCCGIASVYFTCQKTVSLPQTRFQARLTCHTKYHQMPYHRWYICQHWNEYHDQRCSYLNCWYEHVNDHCTYNIIQQSMTLIIRLYYARIIPVNIQGHSNN